MNYWSVQTASPVPPGCSYLRVNTSVNNSEVDLLFNCQESQNQDILDFLNGVSDVMPSALQNLFTDHGLPTPGSEGNQMTSETEESGTSWILTDTCNYKMYFVFVSYDPNTNTETFSFYGGVTKMTETIYDPQTGLVLTTTTYNRDGDNNLETYVQTNVYAYSLQYQQGNYDGMFEQHLFTPIVQTTTSVNNQLTANLITTYKEWQGGGTWAPYMCYRATSPSATFDFTQQDTTQPNWLKTLEVTSRTSKGLIEESYRQDGIYRSILFDQSDNYPVATFVNASIVQQEASYYGCEVYENNPGWQILSSSNQPPTIYQNDAHTGTQCIQLS
ncbi:MAG: hypothetical protein ACRDEA_21325, partial [Microcystaceae cyanobacterium]